jgi:hypothetical protein
VLLALFSIVEGRLFILANCSSNHIHIDYVLAVGPLLDNVN